VALPPTNTPTNPDGPADPRAAAQQDVFMREVDDALREDELKTLLQRYGKPLGAALVLGLTGLAGYLWYESSSRQASEELSERAIIALDKLEAGNIPAAQADYQALAKDGSDGSKAAAAMTLAAILVQQGKNDEGAKAFCGDRG
jgi:hypothetical protein